MAGVAAYAGRVWGRRAAGKKYKCKTPTLECSASKEGEGFWVVTQNKSEEQELNLSRS